MNERYRLNSEMIRAWLASESRKQTYLIERLRVSRAVVSRMLNDGHIPESRVVTAKLADLMGIEEQQLLIPRERARTA